MGIKEAVRNIFASKPPDWEIHTQEKEGVVTIRFLEIEASASSPDNKTLAVLGSMAHFGADEGLFIFWGRHGVRVKYEDPRIFKLPRSEISPGHPDRYEFTKPPVENPIAVSPDGRYVLFGTEIYIWTFWVPQMSGYLMPGIGAGYQVALGSRFSDVWIIEENGGIYSICSSSRNNDVTSRRNIYSSVETLREVEGRFHNFGFTPNSKEAVIAYAADRDPLVIPIVEDKFEKPPGMGIEITHFSI